MSIKHLITYIHLNGGAARAIALYQKALGATPMGEPMRYSQLPGGAVPAEHQDLIMHATLDVGGSKLMISDATPDRPVPENSNLAILVEIADHAELQQRFDALAEGGKVEMPIHDAFWGAKFGVLTDRFGVRWNFHSAPGA
jgi:PhnB protein